MSELRDLYQEVILDHYRQPRNRKEPVGTNVRAEGHNPLCGDRMSIFLEMDGDVVVDAGFQGSGCAISTASASLMTEAIKGKTRAQVEEIFRGFHELVAGEGATDTESLGKLKVLAGVREYPVRVKCASLAWHTLRSALAGEEEDKVTTE